jgi:hypothetical protein
MASFIVCICSAPAFFADRSLSSAAAAPDIAATPTATAAAKAARLIPIKGIRFSLKLSEAPLAPGQIVRKWLRCVNDSGRAKCVLRKDNSLN